MTSYVNKHRKCINPMSWRNATINCYTWRCEKLYYKKFRKDIATIGFKINPYDVCVVNRNVRDNQHTIVWHVDDVKSSHIDSTVNDDFYNWTESQYGSDEIGHVTVTRGTKHDYLGMILDYSQVGALKVDMKYYIEAMLEEFPEEVRE